MSSYIDNLSPKEWEKFCEVMLRQEYGTNNFFAVPDKDRGDLGIEFFTVEGTIFQCYCPEKGVVLSQYKSKIQTKIRNDIKKLSLNEAEISKILDDIVINRWVLLTPENMTKDFIAYCHKKKKEVLSANLPFIDSANFMVKIDTADSYPEGKRFAQLIGIRGKAIDIRVSKVTDEDKNIWKESNSEFADNITRKSAALLGMENNLEDEVVAKYIQIERFLDQLREEHPDVHELIQDSARAQLENMKEGSSLEADFDNDFVNKIIKDNQDAFSKYSEHMSESNTQSLSYGFLSKWLAECYMDFVT